MKTFVRNILPKVLILISFCGFYPVSVKADVIHVPGDSATIQSAVDGAQNGDTVLVAPGIYYENVILHGQNIVLSSHFLFDRDTSYIKSTIINGSTPQHIDTASCILVFSGEDASTIIQGFTLTGGKGTVWPDIENGNALYREGGGILIDESSPTIRNNIISYNIIDDTNGVISTGGGGIRVHHGNPLIINNLIIGNKASYGGAIVLFYSSGTFKNNIIIGNTTWNAYSGATIWISQNFTSPKIFENNTIVGNSTTAEAGGLRVNASSAILRNNIIWGNTQVTGGAIAGTSLITASYNNCQNNLSGDGNIGTYPLFTDTNLFLNQQSPCVDLGNPADEYSDIEDNISAGNALFPSMGELRNDIGAYGGPNAYLFPSFQYLQLSLPASINFGNADTVGIPVLKSFSIVNQSTISIIIDSIRSVSNTNQLSIIASPDTLMPMQSDVISLQWIPEGIEQFSDTLLIYHNASDIPNPRKITINGEAITTVLVEDLLVKPQVIVYPNPFNNLAVIKIRGVRPDSELVIMNSEGRIIKKYNDLNTDCNLIFSHEGILSGNYYYTLKNISSSVSGRFVIIDE